MSTFSVRLRELRKGKQLSGEELGKVFSVTKTAISYWENGKTFPDEDTLKKMADYFNVSLDYLLGRTDDPDGEEEKVNKRNNNKEDEELIVLERARKNMSEEERKKMMDIFKAAFNEFFPEEEDGGDQNK